MAFKTQFAGYAPDSDLSDFDWTKRLSSDAMAIVSGVRVSKVNQDRSNDSLVTYVFSGLVSGPGRYLLGVFGEGATTGIATVELDGVLADEIIADTDGDVDVALYAADLQSFGGGDVEIEFNAGARNGCGVIVWRLEGKSSNAADDIANGAFGTTQLIDVNTRTALVGVSGSTGEDTSHFWTGLLKEITQTVSGTSIQSGASVSKAVDTSDIPVGVSLDNNALDGLWVVGAWDTPVPSMPSGFGIEFSKQSSNANTLWSWNVQAPIADAEVLALLRPTADSDDALFGVSLRARGAPGSEDSYSFVFRQTSAGARDQVAIVKTNGSATITLVGAAESFAWSLDANYWMRFRVRGTTLQAKIWEQGDPEPIGWTIERTDSDVTATGHAGVWHVYTGTEFLVGHFEVKELAAAWPATISDNWDVRISGGPQSNKVSFSPRVGPTIDRRAASAVNRRYRVDVPGLTYEEYLEFVEFYEQTLKQGTLPFTHMDSFSGVEKTYKFGSEDPAYEESVMRPVGPEYIDGIYRLSFTVVRLD